MKVQMTTKSRKNGRNTDGKFGPGNPGRPIGSRHKTTLAVESLLGGEAERLTRKVIELALAGDTTALRLCMDRIAPVPKSRPVKFDIPMVRAAADLPPALTALMQAAGSGNLTPDEAASVAGLLELQRRAIETAEIEARLSALEARPK